MFYAIMAAAAAAVCLSGDVVVCWSPVDPHSTIISRLRALQGDHIEVVWEPGAKPVHMQVGSSPNIGVKQLAGCAKRRWVEAGMCLSCTGQGADWNHKTGRQAAV